MFLNNVLQFPSVIKSVWLLRVVYHEAEISVLENDSGICIPIVGFGCSVALPVHPEMYIFMYSSCIVPSSVGLAAVTLLRPPSPASVWATSQNS